MQNETHKQANRQASKHRKQTTSNNTDGKAIKHKQQTTTDKTPKQSANKQAHNDKQ